MARLLLTLIFAVATLGCGGAESPNGAILEAVEAHLAKRTDLDMSAMELSLSNVEVTGDRAEAEVAFTATGTGQPAMSMNYSLRREGEGWVVEPKQGSTHSMPGQQQAAPMPGGGVPGGGGQGLPPSHPPIEGGAGGQELPPGHPPLSETPEKPE